MIIIVYGDFLIFYFLEIPKLMPPPTGIFDDQERQKLIELAKAFAQAGDLALAYEGEKITPQKTGTNELGSKKSAHFP
ncbi:MAG: hypothetical protein PUP92_36230, partial [Rhizonema sp. PD38]|nr:hypothetical protein [Rhizonema sp. PD38]